MTINPSAPAVAIAEIEIDAAPEVVWDLMTDIEQWPNWNPDVKSATLDGQLAPGTTFRWQAGPGTITSTLQQVEPPRLLAWTGETFGIRALHVWQLEPRDGKTSVRTEESWEGLIVRLFRGGMQQRLEKSIEASLQHLKAAVERR